MKIKPFDIFENTFEQKFGPVYSHIGTLLEFEITGDHNNFVDKILYGHDAKLTRCKVTQSNGADLRYDKTDPTMSDSPLLVNNFLNSILSDCTHSAH